MSLFHKTSLILGLVLLALFAWDIYLYYRPKKQLDDPDKIKKA